MRKKARSTQGSLTGDMGGKHFFSSSFEERKILEYLNNLINSKFLRIMPVNLFSFSRKILGMETTITLLEKHFPEVVSNKEFHQWIKNDQLDDNMPRNILIKFLRNTITPLLNRIQNKQPLSSASDIEERLKVIKEIFGLTNGEIEILYFFYLFSTNDFLNTSSPALLFIISTNPPGNKFDNCCLFA